MSLENEALRSLDKDANGSCQVDKGPRIRYTRDFLLSLSELESCKKLPSGFDRSLLSEFEDTLHSIHDRPRTHNSLSLQGFRRSEYGSSPPTRADSGNYSRNIYGMWESRSSNRIDRDSDSQSDRESDSGRRFGNQSRKSWQGTEHDGLLGSGSFPRPSGHSAGISAPKFRANDQHHLNRSNEPYHPPRPYKAVPLPRRDTDSYNDETFGSNDCTSEDRVEEERRRRDSFELMRKEQLKGNQEKLNGDSNSDVSVLLDDVKEEKLVPDRTDELDSTTNPCAIDTWKSTLHLQAPCRPLIPPGFKNSALEKSSILKSLIQPQAVENGSLSSLERKSSQEIGLHDELPEDKISHMSFLNKDEQSENLSSQSDLSSKKIDVEESLHQTPILPEAHEIQKEPEIIKLNAKVSVPKLSGKLNENDATSILDKIFGNQSTMNIGVSMDSVEHCDNKPGDMWSQETVHKSKFARWFVEEERKMEDEQSSRPNDLLSLIVGSDKGRHQVDMTPLQHFPPEFPDQRPDIASMTTPKVPSATNGVSESVSNVNKQEVIPTVLTCEDLEQTILSEYGDKVPDSQPHLEGWSTSVAKSEQSRAHVDNHASQHLLSLLQKGVNQINATAKIAGNVGSSEIPPASDIHDLLSASYNTEEEVNKNIHTPTDTLTLETLFGTAFMKELKSVEAPVSVQRGSVGSSQEETLESVSQGLSFPAMDGSFASKIDKLELEKMNNENLLASKPLQHVKMDKTDKWLGYDAQIEFNLSNNQAGVVSKLGGFDGSLEYHLPEEESLIAVNDDLNAQISRFMPGRNLSKKESSASNVPGDIAEKLAAIGAAIKDEISTGSDGPPFLHGPYNQMELEMAFRDLHGQASFSHFHSLQMGPGRPLLHPLESHPGHMNSQMKFVGRDNMIQHDAPANQQFPGNMLRPPFSQPNVGLTGFDLPAQHQMLQQMQMPGSFSPHLVNDFPRDAPVPHLGNQASGFMQELNPMPGLPFGTHQPNVRGVGMPFSAPNIISGSNHPEAYQRLVEMELRAKSKQISPFAVGHSQAMYGHELDMGFRYR